MANKSFPEVPRDKILSQYAAYVCAAENVWFIYDRKLWAVYAPEQELFLSPFMYRDFDLPNSRAQNICCLYFNDQAVRYNLKDHYCPIR